MSPIDWYFARGNKQMGPVSAAELKRLAAVAELGPDDLVWREGLTEWATARSVRGLFDEEGKAVTVEETTAKSAGALAAAAEPAAPSAARAAASPTRGRHFGDAMLDRFRLHFNAHFVEATARVFRLCGLYGLLVAMAFSATFAIIVAIKANVLNNLLWGVVLLVVLAALHYVAVKSCDALDRLNRAAGGSLASTMLPDCLAMLSLAAAVTVLLGSVATAVQLSMYWAILAGIAGFIVLGYLAFVALNPASLSIAIAPASDEAIGVIAFLLKALLRVTPVAFGVGVLCGTLMLAYACIEAFSVGGLLTAPITAAAARIILIDSAALPLAAYLLFLLARLALDLCSAILTRPPKVDSAAKPTESSPGA